MNKKEFINYFSDSEKTGKYLKKIIKKYGIAFSSGFCHYASWHPLSVFHLQHMQFSFEKSSNCPYFAFDHCIPAVNGFFFATYTTSRESLKSAIDWANSTENSRFSYYFKYSFIPLERGYDSDLTSTLVVVKSNNKFCDFVRDRAVNMEYIGVRSSFENFLDNIEEEFRSNPQNIDVFNMDYSFGLDLLPATTKSIAIAKVLAMQEVQKNNDRKKNSNPYSNL